MGTLCLSFLVATLAEPGPSTQNSSMVVAQSVAPAHRWLGNRRPQISLTLVSWRNLAGNVNVLLSLNLTVTWIVVVSSFGGFGTFRL